VDPDTCVNGASKLTDIMCDEGGEQGLLYRDCSLGQWVDRTGPGGCELDIPCQASQVDNSKLYSQPGSLTSVLFGEVVVDCADGYEGGGPWVCDAEGKFSGEECSDIDECAGNPCQNGGVCTNGINSYTCTCAAGYLGDDCSDVDECATNPCQNGGVCEDGEDSYTCSCVPGYSGATCQTNIDECAGNPCGSGEVCVDGVYSYTCECAAGYAAGGANDTGCVNINECTTGTDDCSAGQECNDTVGSYLCEEPVCSCSGGKHAEGTDCTSTGELCTHCDFGYKLDDDGTCVNFDECSLGTSWLKSHIVSGGGKQPPRNELRLLPAIKRVRIQMGAYLGTTIYGGVIIVIIMRDPGSQWAGGKHTLLQGRWVALTAHARSAKPVLTATEATAVTPQPASVMAGTPLLIPAVLSTDLARVAARAIQVGTSMPMETTTGGVAKYAVRDTTRPMQEIRLMNVLVYLVQPWMVNTLATLGPRPVPSVNLTPGRGIITLNAHASGSKCKLKKKISVSIACSKWEIAYGTGISPGKTAPTR